MKSFNMAEISIQKREKDSYSNDNNWVEANKNRIQLEQAKRRPQEGALKSS